MKLALPLLILFMTLTAYPIPVDCISQPHEPTIEALISQPYGHIGHVGMDYDIPSGTEVYAVMDGIVVRSDNDSRVYGRAIWILHCDGYLSLYAHLSECRVKFGEIVRAGDLIGLSGGDPHDNIDGDGWSSGAHLHFEIRVPGHLDSNLYNIDPLKYLDMAGRYGQMPKEK